MPIYFLDSSALVKRYIHEKGTQQLLQVLPTADRIVVSHLAMLEVTSATVRRARTGKISSDQLSDVLEALTVELRELFKVVELGRAVVTWAVDLVHTHALRAADAMQLASALIASAESAGRSEFVFVSSDIELNAAARKEGLNVLDPQAA